MQYQKKSKILQEEELKIIIRVNENISYDVDLLDIPKREVIYHLKSKYFRNELENNQQVKFIFLGKILSDSQEISEINFQNGQIIQAYIIQQKSEEQENQQIQQIPVQIIPQDQRIQINQVILQELINQQEQGSNIEMISGFIIGLVFGIIALIIQCTIPCSIKARQGVILGFISQVIIFQIKLSQQTHQVK